MLSRIVCVLIAPLIAGGGASEISCALAVEEAANKVRGEAVASRLWPQIQYAGEAGPLAGAGGALMQQASRLGHLCDLLFQRLQRLFYCLLSGADHCTMIMFWEREKKGKPRRQRTNSPYIRLSKDSCACVHAAWNAQVVDVEQYAMRAFADALESIPIALAENSGLPPIGKPRH
eukprot:1159958-Pelagomonas_calceolata.AAC.19